MLDYWPHITWVQAEEIPAECCWIIVCCFSCLQFLMLFACSWMRIAWVITLGGMNAFEWAIILETNVLINRSACWALCALLKQSLHSSKIHCGFASEVLIISWNGENKICSQRKETRGINPAPCVWHSLRVVWHWIMESCVDKLSHMVKCMRISSYLNQNAIKWMLLITVWLC